MNFLASSDVHLCLEQAKFLVIDNQDSVCVASVIEELLAKLSELEDHSVNISILNESAEFIKETSLLHPTVSLVLFEQLPSMKVSGPFLDVLPTVFSTVPSDQLESLAVNLFELFKNEACIVRVLSILVELPLSARLADTINRMLVDTLHTLPDNHADITALFAISLRINGIKIVQSIVSVWREKLHRASLSSLTAVFEKLWSSLTVFERFGVEWLDQMSNTKDCSKISIADLCIALISFSGSGSANLTRKSKLVLQAAFRLRRIPHKAIISLPSVCPGNEVWERMHTPVWQLCLWLMDPSNNALNTSDSTVAAAASVIELDSEANSSSSDKTSTYAASNSDVLPILAPLVSSLYAAAPTLREGITFSLITQCFPQMQGSVSGNAKLHGSVSTSKSAGKSGSGSGHILLPALGQAHAALSQTEGPARPQGRTFKEDRLYRRQLGRTRAAQRQLAYNRAFVAVNVLLALCQGHSQVSEAVLQALLGRIYQQLADSDKIFPSPAIMHRLLECAAIGAANSPQLESTLLILIQKLLATAAANDASVVAALFTSRALSLDALGGSPFLHGSTVSKVQAVKKLPPSLPLQAYAATTLGVMLAGHLLLRRKSRISVSDHHALLNFITRSEPVLQSPSALYAVDVLATCCHETHRHLRQMQLQGGYGATATAPGSSSASGSVSTGTSSSASCGSASLTSSSHNSASSKNAESLQIMVSNLQIVLDKLSKTVLTRARVNDQRRFDYCILQLKDPTDNDLADPRHIPLEKARHWPLVQLCATTVTTASPELLARSANPEHIAHALQETAIVSSTLFHIIERMSFAATVLDAAQSVLSSVAAESGGGGGRSAPPTALVAGSMSTNSSAVLPAVRISLLRDDTAMARRRVDEMDADEVADPVAGAGPSTAFLTKWSAEASEAFCGEFQLKPELMTATQALMLAWERGLIVATLVGHSQAADKSISASEQSHLLTLKLICQLHACRLMLRAAHSQHMGHKQKEKAPPARNRSSTAKLSGRKTATSSSSSLLKKRKSRSTYYEGSIVGSSKGGASSKRAASSASAFNSGARRREAESAASAQIKNEFSEELQCGQRMSLQRSLTRSIQWVPVSQWLSCLEYILHQEGANPAAATADRSRTTSATSYDRTAALQPIPAGLLTDAGLALVSQVVHRLSLRSGGTAGSGISSNNKAQHRIHSDDHFVSFFEALNLHQCDNGGAEDAAVLEREKRLLDELLCHIPALLAAIQKARINFGDIYGSHSLPRDTSAPSLSGSSSAPGKQSSSGRIEPSAATITNVNPFPGESAGEFLGQRLQSDGLKLLVLLLFALLELRCPALVFSQASDGDGAASLKLLAEKCREYERASAAKESFASIPTAASASSSSSSSHVSNNSGSMVLAAIYNTLEKAILDQHDCAVVTAGLRALHSLVPRRSAALLNRRFSSIGWFSWRSIFAESTSLAVHLLPVGSEVVPGMDESWPMLARAVAAQASLPAVLQEVESRVTKKTESVLSLFRPCFDTKADFHSSRLLTHDHDQLSIAAYRQFLQVWWASEVPSSRVFGVALIIREVFSMMNAESSAAAAATAGNSTSKKKLKSEPRSDTDDSASESEIAKQSSSSSVKKSSQFAVEHLLGRNYAKDVRPRGIFPFLVGSTKEFHLQLTLPLVPVLFLLSNPSAEDALDIPPAAGAAGTSSSSSKSAGMQSTHSKHSSGESYSASAAVGPYRNFAHVCMLFNWMMRRWLDMLHEEVEYLALLIKLAPLLVRVSRAVLAAVEAAVSHAIHWRNEQKAPDPASMAIDVGALKYLQTMMSWALSVMRSIGTFAGTFREMIIQTNQFDVSRILVSSIPSLETCAERYIARLLSVAQSHSLNIVPKEGVDNKKYTSFDTGVSVDVAQVGDQDMLSRMVQFLQRHHNAVLTPLDSSAFTIDLSRSTDVSNGAAAVSSVDYSKAFDEESEAESEDFEFAALTSRHKRNNTFGAESGGGGGGDWGLYSSPSCCEQSVTSASSSMGGDTADGSTEVSENGGLWTDDVASSQSGSESGSDLLDHLMEFYSDED